MARIARRPSWLRRTLAAVATGVATRTARLSRLIRGSYSNAGYEEAHEDDWAYADGLNVNAANSSDIRQTLRERTRQEVDNNGYAWGLVDKLGNDLVKTGPRVQLSIPGVKREVSRSIEKAFQQWALAIGLPWKLRLLDNAAVRDGEGFAVLVTNPTLDPFGVQLDVRLYETDQVSTPVYSTWFDATTFDGGKLDAYGNVTEWHFLKTHPGSNIWNANYLDYESLPAERVLHWFKPRRAGQLRGVPEMLSSLSLYAYLRRYTKATLAAAEFAATVAGVMETDTPMPPAEDGTPQTPAVMDRIQLKPGTLFTTPAGCKSPTQFKPEQPINTYKDFKGEILTEAGQPLGAPRNIATGSSAEYNYSSGRLDHGIYQDGVRVRRHDLRMRVLDKIFRAWLDEALMIEGLIPEGLPRRHLWTWNWFFPGFISLDPEKDAKTDDLRLRNGTTTYAEIFAEYGQDWEEEFEQQAREQERRIELGLPLLVTPPTVPAANTADEEAFDAEPTSAA